MTSAGPGTPLDWPDYDIGFIPAVKRGFTKYVTFTGRASRAEFWWWTLGVSIITVVLYILTMVGLLSAGTRASGPPIMGIVFGILLLVWVLAIILPEIAITVRRLHDAGFSGWFYLLHLIPIGGVVVLVMCIMPTSPNAAQYGPPAPGGYGIPPQPGYPLPPQGRQPHGQQPPHGQNPPQA
ncbi:DUF805 domain-containing protein [Gordonia sp. (in: high G+C Gram-positive bacteria)]|uniref:DUF805 domain-containing protein n=1 Tax=Gordonia sp. (in: high G+C Gram-positive bacteria) TaxID=84139 RepID=UPI00261D1280|nr:DUF805 domain-containing protein [Gordonia sp. (in: high G+C Gram-positive bacteria)]